MKQINVDEYIDGIKIAVELIGDFIEYIEEKKDSYLLRTVIVCSNVPKPEYLSMERVRGYGRLIFRFYEDKYKNFVRMSLCDYRTGLLTDDIDRAMEILGERL